MLQKGDWPKKTTVAGWLPFLHLPWTLTPVLVSLLSGQYKKFQVGREMFSWESNPHLINRGMVNQSTAELHLPELQHGPLTAYHVVEFACFHPHTLSHYPCILTPNMQALYFTLTLKPTPNPTPGPTPALAHHKATGATRCWP
jgi:hypothetical protein